MLFLKYTENECSAKYFYVNENTQTSNNSEKMYTTSLASTIAKKVLMLIRIRMCSHQAEREADTYSLHFYCLTGTLILNIQKANLNDVLIKKKVLILFIHINTVTGTCGTLLFCCLLFVTF